VPGDCDRRPHDSFDVVLCQQGIQFFGDRAAAVREMRRTAKTGGVVVVEVWAAGYPLGPFGPLVAALPAAQQRQVRDDLARRLGATADGVTVRTMSSVARGVK
jgi:ubiquinone/menaquinone biosynthesis C-methylase UbiE